jgi:hypothetical protein
MFIYYRNVDVISKYLRENYKYIYQKHIGFRFSIKDNLAAMKIREFKQEEINEITDKKIVALINDSRSLWRVMIVSFITIFILSIIVGFLKSPNFR